MIKWQKFSYQCPVEITIGLLSGKWKCLMLWHLHEDKKRYRDLRDLVPGVSEKMLSQQLREMEKDGLLTKTVYPEIPPRVEYQLTERGHSLYPILQQMHDWSVEQLGDKITGLTAS